MRRDAYIQNDSGGFSVVSGIAVDAIIEDARRDDGRFVNARHALLLELVGDDSLPVRAVIDEPLSEDENREWLARIRWQLDVPDGRVLLMGGFDPDVLSWWRDKNDPDGDGTGVAVVRVPAGRWNLDVYTYAGSFNGNSLLERGPAPAGQWFRRDHPGVPFPLWLARILDYGGSEDPGYETDWRDSTASLSQGKLAIDTDTRGFIGLLFHLHHRNPDVAADEVPEEIWFPYDAGARELARCPLGIRAEVEDPDLVSLARHLTGEPAPKQSDDQIVWGARVDIMSTWPESAAPLSGGPVNLAVLQTWLAWSIPALCTGGTPSFELRISNAGGWQPNADRPFVAEQGAGDVVVGMPDNLLGWPLWWAMADLYQVLSEVPDGARMELLTAVVPPGEDTPAVGRVRLGGVVNGGLWSIDQASPTITAEALRDALEFTSNLFDQLRIETRTDAERAAWERAYGEWGDFLGEGAVSRSGDVTTFNDPDVRNLVLLAQPVFRARYAGVWSMDIDEDDDDA